MSMLNPCHPGEIVLHDCIEALDLSISDAAAHLQIDEAVLAAVCACEAPVTADLAIRFEQAFGSTADAWLRMQNAYDIAQTKDTQPNVKRLGLEAVTPATTSGNEIVELVAALAAAASPYSSGDLLPQTASTGLAVYDLAKATADDLATFSS